MQTGQLVAGRYEVRTLIGRGGMGEVYLAYDHRLATEVALKRVPAEISAEPPVREALTREAQILASLTQTNIVRLFDLADTAEGMILVLEYVCGPTLQDVLQERGRLPVRELLHVVHEVAAGLSVTHARGIVHRDLKPSNLLIALGEADKRYFLRERRMPPDLTAACIKVTDFGIAKSMARSGATLKTTSGTPAYMAPEQFRGEAPSAETDVYALGLLCWQAIAGRLPIGSVDAAYFHLFLTPPPLDDCPIHVNQAIQRCLAKERAQRFCSVAAFLEALENPAPAPQQHLMPPPAPLFRPPAQRLPKDHTLAWVLAGIAMFLLLAGSGFFLLWRYQVSPLETAAPAVRQQAIPQVDALPPLNPAPFVTELPPVIENARPPGGSRIRPAAGPAWPKIVSLAAIPTMEIAAFGGDGTTYLLDMDGIVGAIRDGRYRWGYSLPGNGFFYALAPDGRLWIRNTGGIHERWFCFNAAGQGGEVSDSSLFRFAPAAARSPSDSDAASPVCIAAADRHGQPALASAPSHSARWIVPLDQECSGKPLGGFDGNWILWTASRTIYMVSGDGRIRWTYAAPCDPSNLAPLSADTLAFVCAGAKEASGVRDGKVQWRLSFSNAVYRAPLSDLAGRAYFMDHGDGLGAAMLYAADAAGNLLWRLPISLRPESFAFTPAGELLVFGYPAGSGVKAVLTVASDAVKP